MEVDDSVGAVGAGHDLSVVAAAGCHGRGAQGDRRGRSDLPRIVVPPEDGVPPGRGAVALPM
jgi:hypothetical protein